MFCPSCGVQRVSDTTRFCTNCGSPVSRASAQAPAQAAGVAQGAPVRYLPQNVQANLVKYKKHVNTICPLCGYSGMVGRIGDAKCGGTWISTFFGILFIFCPIGWMILGTKMLFQHFDLECPNCRARFVKQAPWTQCFNPFD
jgi:hypothetical protein